MSNDSRNVELCSVLSSLMAETNIKRVELSVRGKATSVDLALDHDENGAVHVETPTGRYNLWCAVKPVVATEFLRVAETCDLKLDEPLFAQLETPAPMDSLVAERVTAAQLLSHTAGLLRPNGLDLRLKTPDQHGPLLDAATVEPEWPIGARQGYSECAAWHLLGRALRAMTGQEPEKAVQATLDRILSGEPGASIAVEASNESFEASRPFLRPFYAVTPAGKRLPLLHDCVRGIYQQMRLALGGYASVTGLASWYTQLGAHVSSQAVANAQFPSARYLASAFEGASSSRPDVVLNRHVTFVGGFMTRFSQHDLPEKLDFAIGHLGWHGVSFACWDPLGERGIALVHSEVEPLAEPGRERLRRLLKVVLQVG